MKVTLAAYGGLAAGINLDRPPRQVDTDTLPADEASELGRLVDAALAAPPPARRPPPPPAARRLRHGPGRDELHRDGGARRHDEHPVRLGHRRLTGVRGTP